MSSIVLIGMPGAGKTTVGKALAKRLERPFIDCDRELVARTGVSVATIFEIEGEAGFRAREAALLDELLGKSDWVLATGGGAVLMPINRARMRQAGTVIYLRANLESLWARLCRDTTRPLLQTDQPRARLAAMLNEREPLYQEAAHLIFETGHPNPGKLAEQIANRLSSDSDPIRDTSSHAHAHR